MRTCVSNRSGLTFTVAIGPDVSVIGFMIRLHVTKAISTALPQKIVQPDRNIIPDFSELTERCCRWLSRQITYENPETFHPSFAHDSVAPSQHHKTQYVIRILCS